MPLTFLNGGAPDYLGQTVTNGSDILTNIESTLSTAGWFTQDNSISTGNTVGQSVTMRCTSLVGGTQVYYKFEIQDNSNNVSGGYKLTITGSPNASLSIDVSSPYSLEYLSLNTDSRLWITADDETFSLCLISFASLSGGVHGGFLNRVEPTTDSGAYCIGYILSNVSLKYSGNTVTNPEDTFYQIGQDAHLGRQWYEVLDAYYWSAFNITPSGRMILPVQGFFDRYTTVLVPYRRFIEDSASFAPSNAGFMAQNGNINGVDSKAVLGEWFVTEGRSNDSDYDTPGVLQTPLYYRGSTKFNVVGMASFAAGIQVEDTANRRYLSVGPVGWAGMRIA